MYNNIINEGKTYTADMGFYKHMRLLKNQQETMCLNIRYTKN